MLTATAIIFAAIALRLVLNFRYPLPPATDGAYYPLQTWWLLEHGRLMFHDLPLIFWLNAAATKLIQAVSGTDLQPAAVLASRLIDGVAQPWTAAPILMLGYTWSNKNRGALLGCAAAAVLAVMSPPIMRMASDFQKNSLGLVWMVVSLWALREALAHRQSLRRWARLAVFIALAGLTHIGAFGVTCVMLGSATAAYIPLGGPPRLTRRNVAIAAAATAGATALVLVMLQLEPTRTTRMLSTPLRLFDTGNLHASPPGIALALAVYAALALLLRSAWRDRQNIQRCDLAVVFGAAIALATLVFPFMPGDYAMRFSLMATVPAAVLTAFVVARRAANGKPRRPARVLAVAALMLALAAPFVMQGPSISPAAVDELRAFRDEIHDPAHTLVVAEHGVEFWAGLALHTPVSMERIPDNAFTKYTRVLIVKQNVNTPDHMPPEPATDGRRRPEPRPRHEMTVPTNAAPVRAGTYFNLYEIHPETASPRARATPVQTQPDPSSTPPASRPPATTPSAQHRSIPPAR